MIEATSTLAEADTPASDEFGLSGKVLPSRLSPFC